MKTFKKLLLPLVFLALCVGLWFYRDRLLAQWSGADGAQLLNASAPFAFPVGHAAADAEWVQLEEQGGVLRLIVRTHFMRPGEVARPYLEVDAQQHGTLQLGIQGGVSLGHNVCPALRQVELELPRAAWASLASLQVHNMDTDRTVGPRLPVGDAAAWREALQRWAPQAATSSLEGSQPMCQKKH
jgi:hypothetical protein